MATSIFKEVLRDKFEQATGSFGDIMREARLRKERAEEIKKRVEIIEETTTQLRTTRSSLSSIEKHFILISKNVQILAQAMGAQVTIQEETDKVLKEIDELRKKKTKPKKDVGLARKANRQSQEENDDISGLFQNLFDLFGYRRKPPKKPPKRPPKRTRTPKQPRPPRKPPKGRRIPGTRIPGRRVPGTRIPGQRQTRIPPAEIERRARRAATRAYNRALRRGVPPQQAKRIFENTLRQGRARGQRGAGRGPSAQQAAREAAFNREMARRQAALDAEQKRIQADQKKLSAEKAAAEEKYKKLRAEAEARANAIEEQRKKVAAEQAAEQKRIQAEKENIGKQRAQIDAERKNIETERARVQAAQADVETQRARLNADATKAEQVNKAALTANEARAAQLKTEAAELDAHKQRFNKMQSEFNESYAKRAALLSEQERLANERLKVAATESERIAAERAKIDAEKARLANDADFRRVNAEYEAENRRLAMQQGRVQAEQRRIAESNKPAPTPAPEPAKPPPSTAPQRVTAPSVQQTKPIKPVNDTARKAIGLIARNKLARAAGAAVAKKLPFIGLAVGLGFAAWELVRGQITQAAISIGETFDPTLFGVTAATLIPRIRLETYEEYFGTDPNIDPENPGGMISGPRWLVVVDIVDEEWELLKQQMKDNWNKTKEQILNSWKSDYKQIKEKGFGTWLKESSINVNAPTARERRAQERLRQQQNLNNPEPPAPPPPSPVTTAPLSGITPEDEPIMAMIKKHEGSIPTPYKDSEGLWTVGVGHLIGNGKTLPPEWNRTFTEREIDELFAKDYLKHKEGAMKGPGYDKANQTGRAALIDLAFNMGNSWYKEFPKTWLALRQGNFLTASEELQDSKWYRQVGNRGPTIVSMIRAGSDMSMNTFVPTQNQTGIQLAQSSAQISAANEKPNVSPTIIVAHNTTQALAASSGPQGRVEYMPTVGA